MKLTKKQYNSLFAVICMMIIALMVITFGYVYEFGINALILHEESDRETVETDITIETLPYADIALETTETKPKSTESVETITIFDEESTESEPSIYELTPTYTDSKQAIEAVPTVYEEEFPWHTSDYELLARLVWAEARGESYEGQLAVVEVVFNRVASDNFPNTVYEVIYEPGQFTTASSLEYVTPTQEQYDIVTAALRMERVLNNEKCVYFNTGNCCGTYYMTIGNHVFGCE